jgi:predicted GNAT family acetyltransferase
MKKLKKSFGFRNMNNQLFIGIDADTQKSGVAVWEYKLLELYNLTFFELFEFLKRQPKERTAVIIEAGWLNTKSSWHGHGYGEGVAARTGAKVGANHETGKKIAEMCDYLDLTYELKKPESSKVDAKYFKMLTKYEGRTNSETRDAGLLVFGK